MSSAMTIFVSQWSHAIAAILFGVLGIWQVQRQRLDAQTSMLMAASLVTALWALLTAMSSYDSIGAQLAEQLRNAAWLGFMYMLWRRGDVEHKPGSVTALYLVLTLVIAAELTLIALSPSLISTSRLIESVLLASTVLKLVLVVGTLVLVHNLYSAATVDARSAIRLPMLALALMWLYDLNLYMVVYVSRSWIDELFALRGIAMVLMAPVMALAAHRTQNWNITLSRAVAFQSFSLVAIGLYVVVMLSISSALELVGGESARMLQVSFVFGASVIALILLPSSTFRAWFRVKISKHLFQHRYDYRAEWIRFTDTLGRPGEAAQPLQTRVIQAIADIVESPGGILLIPDPSGGLVTHAKWNWQLADPPSSAATTEAAHWLKENGRVVELDGLRRAGTDADDEASRIPEWIIAEPRAWAMVPLVHFNQLAGVVVLSRPIINRTLDWEDFDLLRVVGRQVASYLSEARGQEALSDAKRFDEFNRRFAFIMHDIKNLVSQLSLVARNAERHADNPEFRADMIVTLKSSVARMNGLLARLSQHNKSRAEEPRAMQVDNVSTRVAEIKRAHHPIVIGGVRGLTAMADPARLEQAISHLVQNAIDASAASEPVSINMRQTGSEIILDVVDRGVGMSPAFIRERLFRPFTSTKDSGFGIGAYEAKALINAMGGRIEVTSREGKGSCFSVILPGASESNRFILEKQVAA